VEGDFIGVFEVAADGDTIGEAADGYLKRAKNFGEVHGGRFPFDGRVGGYDDLLDGIVCETAQKLADVQTVGAEPFMGERTPPRATKRLLSAVCF